MKCPNCNAEVIGRFCSYCGSELPQESSVNIKGNQNTVITNNFYNKEIHNKEYIEPELEEFIPRDFEPYKQKLIIKSIFIIFVSFFLALFIGQISNVILSVCIILLFLIAKKLYDNYRQAYEDFYEEEYQREYSVYERNYQREYDAWFNSLNEEEKQTELLRQLIEKEKNNK